MHISQTEIDDTLCPLPIDLHLTFADCYAIVEKLRSCGCANCLRLADTTNTAMIQTILDAQLSPAISSRLDQRLASQRTEFRIQILGKQYLERLQPSFAQMAAMPARLSDLLTSLDMSQPLDELTTIIHAAADADRNLP